MGNEELVESLRKEASRVEEDALYSAKGHFSAALTWRSRHFQLGIPTAILAAAAGTSAIARETMIAGVIGLLASALTALLVFLNPSDRAQQHHVAGTRFTEIKNQARFFREIELKSGADAAGLVPRLQRLASQRDELNKSSPAIPAAAFERARRSIEAGEADYAVDTGDAAD